MFSKFKLQKKATLAVTAQGLNNQMSSAQIGIDSAHVNCEYMLTTAASAGQKSPNCSCSITLEEAISYQNSGRHVRKISCGEHHDLLSSVFTLRIDSRASGIPSSGSFLRQLIKSTARTDTILLFSSANHHSRMEDCGQDVQISIKSIRKASCPRFHSFCH